MSNILVTGGTGYLGGRIVSHLANTGHHVVTGTRNLIQANKSNCILTDFENMDSLVKTFDGFDVIIHLAGMNEIEASKNPEKALHTTATYTLRAINAAKRAHVSRFIYFSTVHVYGSPLLGVLTENSTPRPIHPYSITHRTAEDFVYQAHLDGAFWGTIFRLSNAYGYPETLNIDRWTLLVNDLCRQVASTGKLTLKSSGLQYRDFIPLCDVCNAVTYFITAPRQNNPLFNLGSGTSTTVLEMTKLIASRYEVITGRKAIMEIPIACSEDKVNFFNLSIEKLLSVGLSPQNLVNSEIDECIRRCLVWEKKETN